MLLILFWDAQNESVRQYKYKNEDDAGWNGTTYVMCSYFRQSELRNPFGSTHNQRLKYENITDTNVFVCIRIFVCIQISVSPDLCPFRFHEKSSPIFWDYIHGKVGILTIFTLIEARLASFNFTRKTPQFLVLHGLHGKMAILTVFALVYIH